MATLDLSEAKVKSYPEEINKMPCFKCNGNMVGVEYIVPVYKKDSKLNLTKKRNKTMYSYKCSVCGAETSLFAHWETVFNSRRQLKKYYDDVNLSLQSGGGQLLCAA